MATYDMKRKADEFTSVSDSKKARTDVAIYQEEKSIVIQNQGVSI